MELNEDVRRCKSGFPKKQTDNEKWICMRKYERIGVIREATLKKMKTLSKDSKKLQRVPSLLST